MTVLLDDRGKLCAAMSRELPEALAVKRDLDEEVTVTRLDEGDIYWEGKNAQVWGELKTAEDLVVSLLSGHMQDQEARMLDLPGDKLLLVSGRLMSGERGNTLAEKHTNREWLRSFASKSRTVTSDESVSWRRLEYAFSGVVNYLSRLQEFGFTVVQTGHEDAATALAATIARSFKSSITVSPRRTAASLDPRVRALKCLPEFERTPVRTVEEIVKNYWRSPLRPVDKRELAKLPGVGKKTIERVLQHAE